jgi:hypothetical protein
MGNNSSDKDSSNFNFSFSSVIEEKSSEEKDIDKFLDDAHKKSVADNIRRCNKGTYTYYVIFSLI